MADEIHPDAPGFEAAVRLLEQAVEDLESGELGLDAALRRYEEGVKLLRHCYHLLDSAEQSVALITGVDAEGNPHTVPFDAAATLAREPAFEPSSAAEATSIPIETDEDPDDDLPF